MYASVIHLRDSATGRTLTSAPTGTVLASSARLGWRSITVERHRLPGSEFPEHQVIGHQLSIHVGEPVDLELRLGGRWRTERRTSGAVDFVPHGALSVPRWRPYHFARLFRRTVGVPPHQYVLRRRVERAKELLLTGRLGLSEVALAAGFSDQSHLTRVFRRAVGLTPARFRRAG